jgi:hypothetical protein
VNRATTAQRLTDPLTEDSAVQEVILRHVLDEHPTLLSRSDLIREFPGRGDAWAGQDGVERAIAVLVKRGALNLLDDYVIPTRAALHCRLLGGF